MAGKMREKAQLRTGFGLRRNLFDRITLNDWGPSGPMLPFRAFQVDKRLNASLNGPGLTPGYAPNRYQQS